MDVTEIDIRRELWMWRGLAILAVLILTILTVFADLEDRDRHASDNKERAKAWTTIELNQDVIKAMEYRNYELILRVDEVLQRTRIDTAAANKQRADRLAIRNRGLDADQRIRDENQAIRDKKGKK
jgi:hypothetical protein